MSGPTSRSRTRSRARSSMPGSRTRHSSIERRPGSPSTATRSSRGRSRRASVSPASQRRRSASLRTPTRARTGRSCAGRSAITEHVTAVDNVLSLINLGLLTGHVGRYGSGSESAARTEQRPGRRRHGRDPEQAAGFPGRRERSRCAGTVRGRVGRRSCRPSRGWHLAEMFEAMERGELRHALRIRREPRAVGGGLQEARSSCSRDSTS